MADEKDFNAEYFAVPLGGKSPNSRGWWRCECPAKKHKSGLTLGIKDADNGDVIIKCHAGCSDEEVRDAIIAKGIITAEEYRAVAEGLRGCTLARYAAAKRLDVDFLRELGLTDSRKYGKSLRIPYFDETGEELAVRYRISLSGRDRFRWEKGAKAGLYGLSRVASAREKGEIAVVEGESDCHALWFDNFEALGLPGAASWSEARDARHFDGPRKIVSAGEKIPQ